MNGKKQGLFDPTKRRLLALLGLTALCLLSVCSGEAPPAPSPAATPVISPTTSPASPAVHEQYHNLFSEADYYHQGKIIGTYHLPLERCTQEHGEIEVRLLADLPPAARPVLGLRLTTYTEQHTSPLDEQIIFAAVAGQKIPVRLETLNDAAKGIAIYTWRLDPAWKSVRVTISKPTRFQLVLMAEDIDWSAYSLLLAGDGKGSPGDRPCFP